MESRRLGTIGALFLWCICLTLVYGSSEQPILVAPCKPVISIEARKHKRGLSGDKVKFRKQTLSNTSRSAVDFLRN